MALKLPVALVLFLQGLAGAETVAPVIRYANLLGGSGRDTPEAVAVGPGGYIYIAGRTESTDFPNAKRLSDSHGLLGDVFVVKLDPSGASIVYSVIVGGGQPSAIAVDSAGS